MRAVLWIKIFAGMKAIARKHWFLVLSLVIHLIVLLFDSSVGMTVLRFTGKNALNFVFLLVPVFLLTGLMDVWIDRETMIRMIGEKSGLRGVLPAFLLGMVTAVPVYALLPVGGILLKKGSRISNVLIFLGASASIRIPLLIFESGSLGFRFAVTRFVANIFAVFAISFIVEKALTGKDKAAIYENAEKSIPQ